MTKRTADQIYDSVLNRIVDGDLRPGDSLGEQSLAAAFGLSRTPVREALQRLANEGLTERGPRRTFVVRRMGQAELHDLFEALGELEALMARLAALRMTEIERHALREIVSDSERPGIDYEQANARFHEALQLGAHNGMLSNLLADLKNRTMPWRGAQFRARADRVTSSQTEHRAILKAVLARDGDQAHLQMRDHMAASMRVIAELIGT
ncbi:DNA-binding transcriptional regulator, GntR family [Loktanella fryxellensis]|uniref:DNA-binding transcriptional regulator, GntR family n=1 Tax=Loktanella fryxellensis TaxID=245187 RepID=A0A1H8BVA2_9RHOB|nr:GntR family transcriptional regulator [Loktanella fryxellensis]SEM86074.1 DNA-binding transcriptional regulator, GntR family [Loktanella fryxellensis]